MPRVGSLRRRQRRRVEPSETGKLPPVRQVPAAVEQLPGQLKCNEGFAGSGSQRQQDALLVVGNGLQCCLNGIVLVVPRLPGSTPVLKRDSREAVMPCIGLGKDLVPELLRSRVLKNVLLVSRMHVDLVNAFPVG